MTIYFLGGGNMAAAIVAGLCQAERTAEIHVANRGAEKRVALAAKYGVTVSEKLPTLTKNDVLILAVKPQDMQAACENVASNGALVISLAAGLSIATLSRYLDGTQRMIRAMPNTPAQIGLGVTGLFAASAVGEADKHIAQAIFATSGSTVWLNDEAQMHAITAVSGSGSAYVFYLMNALQQAALDLGFDAEQARTLSLQTFKGAVALAEHTGEELRVLQDKVTSKGGTTFAALTHFDEQQVAQHIGAGVQAACARSQELAKMFE